VAAIVLIISLLCIWFYPSVQDFMAGNAMWNGIGDFCDEFGADNIDSLEELPEPAEGVVLVVIPYIEYSATERDRLQEFVEGGGTLLLMDDYGYGNDLLAQFGLRARFSHQPLLDPLFCYKNQSMPRITDFAPDMEGSGVELVMLNHATGLVDTDDVTIIAWSSSASFIDANGNGVEDEGEVPGPWPVAAETRLGRGRLVMVSDPSTIINTMVGRDDNYAFINHLIESGGEPVAILVDRAHLHRTPLDVSQARLDDTRAVLSSPYALVGITAMVFAVTAGYTLKKGETSD
jgi:hypothetical protein